MVLHVTCTDGCDEALPFFLFLQYLLHSSRLFEESPNTSSYHEATSSISSWKLWVKILQFKLKADSIYSLTIFLNH